ncbi:unnamed protein product [Ranitomeya imitator]|uniref:Uncharacterized protein n=1 Tax=Ranitomeya imitator TaxID=111125 RepID=A0ABN9MGV5_9NEOB|nr:unnamed protein product [Ranitomeya imitator]
MTSDAGDMHAAADVSCQPQIGWRLLTIDVRAQARTSIALNSCSANKGPVLPAAAGSKTVTRSQSINNDVNSTVRLTRQEQRIRRHTLTSGIDYNTVTSSVHH